MTKAELRARMRAVLAELSPAERVRRSAAACAELARQPEFAAAGTILLFLSLPDEVQTDELAEWAWSSGRRVAAPWVDWERRELRPVRIESLARGLTIGPRGVRQPPPAPVLGLDELDLVVVPGLAFDRTGYRLGRGAGFYDRFLATPGLRAVRCGLGFAEQVVTAVPREPWDHPLDRLVVDGEVIEPLRNRESAR